MTRFFFLLFLANFALAQATSGDTAAAIPPQGLDQTRIQNDYVNGDFEKVQLEITRFQSQTSRYSRSDSLCIARHLSVIHAANPLTVEVGKHWMYELFKIDSMATVSDMYVSEEIDRLFNKVRAEFISRQKPRAPAPLQPVATSPMQKPSVETPVANPQVGSSKRTGWNKSLYWMMGGAVAAAAATTAIVLLAPEDAKPGAPKEYIIRKEVAAP